MVLLIQDLGRWNYFTVKSMQENLLMCKVTRNDFRVKRAATSIQQLEDLGMRGFQASFPRI